MRTLIHSLLLSLLAFSLLSSCAQPDQSIEPKPTQTGKLETTRTPALLPQDQTLLSDPPSLALVDDDTALWPTEDWQTSTPQEEGVDGEKLDAMLDDIRQNNLNLHSMLVIRHGKIISETYFSNYTATTQHHLFSVTKSFIGTLAGIAYGQGKLDIEKPVLSLFPNRTFANASPEKDALQVKHLLTMTSGLGWQEGDPFYIQLVRSPDWVKTMLDLPMDAQPGETYRYCSGCSYLISAVIQQATGQNTLAFAKENLLTPLGITDFNWETDPQGTPNGGWGLYLTPRDMAKLGYLYLHRGRWENRQIIASDWISASTTRLAVSGGRHDYGYQWWMYHSDNAYMATGRSGQLILVVPEKDLIVVTTADMQDGHDTIYRLIDTYILPAVQ